MAFPDLVISKSGQEPLEVRQAEELQIFERLAVQVDRPALVLRQGVDDLQESSFHFGLDIGFLHNALFPDNGARISLVLQPGDDGFGVTASQEGDELSPVFLQGGEDKALQDIGCFLQACQFRFHALQKKLMPEIRQLRGALGDLLF